MRCNIRIAWGQNVLFRDSNGRPLAYESSAQDVSSTLVSLLLIVTKL